MNFKFSLKLMLLVIMFFAEAGDATNLTGVDNILRIEMDIFSGRENPFWNLNINESEFFIEKILSLPEGNMNESIDAGLGYRGLIITGDLLKDKCIDEIRIFGGLANVMAMDNVSNLSDSGRDLELWLIETSRTHIDSQLYDSVHKEVTNATS